MLLNSDVEVSLFYKWSKCRWRVEGEDAEGMVGRYRGGEEGE